jgi:hypothetical protein
MTKIASIASLIETVGELVSDRPLIVEEENTAMLQQPQLDATATMAANWHDVGQTHIVGGDASRRGGPNTQQGPSAGAAGDGKVAWRDGVMQSLEPAGHGCDIGEDIDTVWSTSAADARAKCIAAWHKKGSKLVLDWTKVEAQCVAGSGSSSGSGCTLTFGPLVCAEVPLVVTSGARIADGIASPWATIGRSGSEAVDAKSMSLRNAAITTRTVDMAAAEIFWIKCGDDVGYTFGVNATEATRKIANARRRLARTKFATRPPNFYTLVMDSLSRADFVRSFQPLVRKLREIDTAGGAEVYEFFRHSTVGWGTGANVPMMLTGGSAIPGHGAKDNNPDPLAPDTDPTFDYPDKRMFVPMHEFLRSAGYAVLGQEDEYYDAPKPGNEFKRAHIYFGEITEPWLSKPKTSKRSKTTLRGCNLQRHQLDAELEALTRMDLYYDFVAPDVPRYFAMHSGEIHNGKSLGILEGQSPSFIDFFNAIDLAKTVVTLAGDHGMLAATISHPLVPFEKANPLWLWVLPAKFATPAQRQNLLANGQLLTTHVDTHYTLKAMLGRYADAEVLARSPEEMCDDPAMNQGCNVTVGRKISSLRGGLKNTTWLVPGGFPATVDTVSYAFDLMNERVLPNRTCTDARIPKGFCACNMIPGVVHVHDHPLFEQGLEDAVKELNALTGDGKLLCSSFTPGDFGIRAIVKTGDTYKMELRQKSGPLDVTATLTSDKRLMIGKSKYFGKKMGILSRQDSYSKECCLLDIEDHPPTFNKAIGGFKADPEAPSAWTQEGYTTQFPRLYLRLCRCDDSKCRPGFIVNVTYFANSAMARKFAALMKSCGASCQEMSNTFGIHHQLTWGSVSEQCRELWHKWACKTVPM